MKNTLFESETIKKSKFKCKDCGSCLKLECGSKYFFYCAILKSNRTSNGKLKIKANQEACIFFKHGF